MSWAVYYLGIHCLIPFPIERLNLNAIANCCLDFVSFFANSAAAQHIFENSIALSSEKFRHDFLREKYLCGLKFRGCKELFADGIDILLQNGAWVVRWAAVANWAWPVVLGIIPEQFCIKPQSVVKEGWMALVQWTSRELLCTRAMY